jgi:hypothetical protein
MWRRAWDSTKRTAFYGALGSATFLAGAGVGVFMHMNGFERYADSVYEARDCTGQFPDAPEGRENEPVTGKITGCPQRYFDEWVRMSPDDANLRSKKEIEGAIRSELQRIDTERRPDLNRCVILGSLAGLMAGGGTIYAATRLRWHGSLRKGKAEREFMSVPTQREIGSTNPILEIGPAPGRQQPRGERYRH